jgi:hypothetical protein
MFDNDPSLMFVCPVCEAARGEPCHLQIGVVRFESHYERKNLADDEVLDNIIQGNAVALLNALRVSGNWRPS